MKKITFLLLSLFLFIAPATTSFAFTDTTSATQSNIVNTLANDGIILGYPDKTFKPNEKITRGQVAAIISRSVKLPSPRPTKEFLDVPKTHPFYDAIQQLYKAQIVDGTDQNKFHPDEPISRGELAKVLALTFNLPLTNTTIFNDVPHDYLFNSYIGALANKNWTVGYPDGTYKPNQQVTRGEFAIFIYRALYSKEPIIDATNIHDLTRYQPTYLQYIAYDFVKYDGSYQSSKDYIKQNNTVFSDPKGPLSFNVQKDFFLYGTNYSDDIYGVAYSPLIANQTTSVTINTSPHPADLTTFKMNLTYVNNFKIKAGTFQNVSKITVTTSDNPNSKSILYLKEGYGLLKHEFANPNQPIKTTFELTDFQLK